MKKRVLSFVLTINMLFLMLTGRLFVLSSPSEKVGTQQGVRVKEIDTSRGNIYDRKLVPFTNSAMNTVACIKPTSSALQALHGYDNDTDTLSLLADGNFVLKEVESGEIFKDCRDISCLPVYERYSDNTLLHILGYTDSTDTGVSGIEKYFNEELKNAGGALSVAYYTDANGRMLTDEPAEIRDNGYYTKSGLALTIDKKMQSILEAAMENGNIEKGAGIILDVQSNEILACASFPIYDRENISSALNDTRAPFINRAFSQFPVGSVFKVVTSAAAIESGVLLRQYNCNGKITLNGNTFNCSKLDGHGEIDFTTALAKSCNPYFIDIGVKAGAQSILKLSQKLRLGESTDFGNGYVTDTGILPDADELVSNADTGNLAFGQGRLSATPLQIATVFSCIANDGYYTAPSLILGTVDKSGNLLKSTKEKTKEKVISSEACNIIKTALAKTVTEGTGTTAQSNIYTCCTKTATAQSGQYDENGNEIKFCWFVGFFPKENPQYTICIMKEQGSSGGSDCGPVFKEIAENILFNF